MRFLAVSILLFIGCSATDRAALRDCAVKVLPNQMLNVAAKCGFEDKACLEQEGKQRAIIAAAELDVCMAQPRGDAAQD